LSLQQIPASSSGNELITKLNTKGSDRIYNTTGVTPTGGSPWVEVDASLSADKYLTGVVVNITAVTSGTIADWPVYVNFGRGASGSEVTIGEVAVVPNATPIGNGGFALLTPYIRIAAGQRLAVRLITQGTAGTYTFRVVTYGLPTANLQGN
jgi:hypothetical protein